jgi:hypothetical protein
MGFEMFSSNTKSHDKIILKLPPTTTSRVEVEIKTQNSLQTLEKKATMLQQVRSVF